MKELIAKYKGLIIVGIIILIAIPVILMGFKKGGKMTTVKNSGEPISIIITPEEQSLSVGQLLKTEVVINGAKNNISALDISITYDSNLLGSAVFTPAPTFTTILMEEKTPGTIHFVGVNPAATEINGSSINAGALNFTAKKAGSAKVGFSNVHVNASGVDGALPVANQKESIYTIN